jgi:folate-binding protein YgfZ
MANNDWQEFQCTQSAVFNKETIVSFGNIQNELLSAAQADILCDLSDLTTLAVSGDDALTFLQGQVTNDVNLLGSDKAHYSGYCSPKGRLLALFLAYRQAEAIHLQFNGELAEPIAKRLKMYVMRSKVKLDNIGDDIVKLGISGANAKQALSAFFSTIPALALELSHNENGTLIRLSGPLPRFEIVCNTDSAKRIWSELKKTCQPVGKAAWEWLEIQAGIPDIALSTQEEFVPQMVNLDCLNGINFKKGCYTGQEIVARTHYLGKVKRRTHLLHLATSAPTQAGMDVATDKQDVVGKVVRAAPAPNGGYDVLAEIRLDSMEAGDLFINGVKLELRTLPYALSAD